MLYSINILSVRFNCIQINRINLFLKKKLNINLKKEIRKTKLN